MTDEDDVTATQAEGAVEADDKVDATEDAQPSGDIDGEQDGLEEDTAEAVDAEPKEGAATARRRSRRILPIVLVVVFVLSAGAASIAYFAIHRSDQRVDQAVAASVIQAASDGAVTLLSYSPSTLDADFSKAKSRLTGDFLNYYTQFTQEIVTPAAKQKSVQTTATVARSALSRIDPTSAEVLLFINQATTSKENPDGSFTASSVKVGLTKVGNDWLISSFDPV